MITTTVSVAEHSDTQCVMSSHMAVRLDVIESVTDWSSGVASLPSSRPIPEKIAHSSTAATDEPQGDVADVHVRAQMASTIA